MNSPKIVQNYLRKFGFDKWQVEVSTTKLYENIFVIPAIDEFENIQTLLKSLLNNSNKYFLSTLFLFVINNLKSSSQKVKDENQKSISFLRSIMKGKIENNLSNEVRNSELNIALVDASSHNLELPEKDGGVGLARKIGMDLALTLFDYESTKKKILFCLDADCIVEKNYLETMIEETNKKIISAGYVEYEHLMPEDDEEKKAIILYELFLRYYVLGLKYANSPFAFDTIGSTMFCDFEHYVKIGGMNKKKAAEDFYFLEKLAKVTRIQKINSTKIYPSSRKSWRVPFGTGQRISRYFQKTHNEYLLYEPESFVILKKWLNEFINGRILSSEEYLSIANSIHPELKKFLLIQSFDIAWNKIVNETKNSEQIQKQKQFWFDGFRTLKLIHHLRDNSFPMINTFVAIEKLFSLLNVEFKNESEKLSWQYMFQYLQKIRELNF